MFGLGGRYVGAHILPTKRDQTGHGISASQRRLQNVGQGDEAHLNFAIISLMPGIVSI